MDKNLNISRDLIVSLVSVSVSHPSLFSSAFPSLLVCIICLLCLITKLTCSDTFFFLAHCPHYCQQSQKAPFSQESFFLFLHPVTLTAPENIAFATDYHKWLWWLLFLAITTPTCSHFRIHILKALGRIEDALDFLLVLTYNKVTIRGASIKQFRSTNFSFLKDLNTLTLVLTS